MPFPSTLALNNPGAFRPAWWARGGHVQTVVGYYFPAAERLQQTHFHTVKLGDGEALRLCENRSPENTPTHGVVLLLHGLGGSAQSPYMLRTATPFRNHSWIVFRMNHRGCGEGCGLARKSNWLYERRFVRMVKTSLRERAEDFPDFPR